MSIKSIRRLTAAGLCVLMCAASFLTAFADSEPVTIAECGNLQLTLPDNMSAVTRSSDSSDRYFSRHNLTYQEVQEMFSKTDTYMQAMDNDNVITLTLTYSDTDINDFNKFTNAELAEVAHNFITESGTDVKYKNSTQDEAGKEMVWLYFETSVRDAAANTDKKQYQATTVYNGKNITLTILRNEGDAEASDYSTLESVAKTVKFPAKEKPADKKMLMLIVIGAGAAIIIILLIIIIVTVKKSKRRKAKARNDKILEELADKYQTRPNKPQPAVKQESAAPKQEYSDNDEYQDIEKPLPSESIQSFSKSYDEAYDDDMPKRKYSDEDIARLLGDLEDDENFIDTLPETEADSDGDAEVRDSVIQKNDVISEFFEDEEDASINAAEEAVSAYTDPVEEAPGQTEEETNTPTAEEAPDTSDDETEEEPADSGEPEEPVEESPDEEQTEISEEAEAAGDQTEVSEETEPVEEQSENSGEAKAEEKENSDDGKSESDDEADEEFDELLNDEVLVREESRQERFKNSNDFFEEAPRRIFGVISSKQIADAEEYDVIGEEEQRAVEIEKEQPKAKERKSFGASVKSFFTHCGYFATNVKREIKRKRAKSKRKKAEEERRRRQMERRQQERAVKERRRDSNGLVQVRSRDDRPRNPRQ